MNALFHLVSRNLKAAFRSRAVWAYILLPLVILAVLYPLLLAGLHADAARQAPGGVPFAAWLARSWTAAALPVVLAFTAALGSLGVLSRDRHERRYRDFGTTFLGNGRQAAGYAVAVIVSACVAALVVFALVQALVHISMGLVPDWRGILFALGYTMLGAVHAASFCLFLVALLRSGAAYAVVSGLMGMLAGFLTGSFVPVGMLNPGIRMVVEAFPASHAVSLARQALTWPATAGAFGAPGADLAWYQSYFGITQRFGERAIEPGWSLLFLVGTTLVLFAAALPLAARGCRPVKR